jgi:hypothetical protein
MVQRFGDSPFWDCRFESISQVEGFLKIIIHDDF